MLLSLIFMSPVQGIDVPAPGNPSALAGHPGDDAGVARAVRRRPSSASSPGSGSTCTIRPTAGRSPTRRTSWRSPHRDGSADVILAFFTRADEIGGQIGELARRIYPAGALWVAWPRRAACDRSDITDTVIRSRALPIGLVDVKVAAIDDVLVGPAGGLAHRAPPVNV